MGKFSKQIQTKGFKPGEFKTTIEGFKACNQFEKTAFKIIAIVNKIGQQCGPSGAPDQKQPAKWDGLKTQYSTLTKLLTTALNDVKKDKEAATFCKDFLEIVNAYATRIDQWGAEAEKPVAQPGQAKPDAAPAPQHRKPAKPMEFRKREDKHNPEKGIDDQVIIGDDEDPNETPGNADDDKRLVAAETKKAMQIQQFCEAAPKRLPTAVKSQLQTYQKVVVRAKETLQKLIGEYKTAVANDDVEAIGKVVVGLDGMADRFNLDVIRSTVGNAIRNSADALMEEARSVSAKYPYKTNAGAMGRLSNADFKPIMAQMTAAEQELKSKFDNQTYSIENATAAALKAARAKLDALNVV